MVPAASASRRCSSNTSVEATAASRRHSWTTVTTSHKDTVAVRENCGRDIHHSNTAVARQQQPRNSSDNGADDSLLSSADESFTSAQESLSDRTSSPVAAQPAGLSVNSGHYKSNINRPRMVQIRSPSYDKDEIRQQQIQQQQRSFSSSSRKATTTTTTSQTTRSQKQKQQPRNCENNFHSSNRTDPTALTDESATTLDYTQNNNNNNNNKEEGSGLSWNQQPQPPALEATGRSSSDGESVQAQPPPEDNNSNNKKFLGNSRLERCRQASGSFVNHTWTQAVMIFLIVVNAIMMGLATFDFVTDSVNVTNGFEIADLVFLSIFTAELALQFVYHGLALFLDGWLLFDFIIIVLSWSFSSLQVVRTIRVFRVLRLVTRTKALRNLVVSLFAVAPSISAIIALLLLVMYIYAVTCTLLFKDLYEMGVTDLNYFGRIDSTLFYLFQMMTLEWSDIVRQVMVKYWWAGIVFTSFLVFSSFILYSLIVAVICDAVTVVEHKDEIELERQEKEQTRQHILHLESRLKDMTVQQMEMMQSLQKALVLLQQNNNSNNTNQSSQTSFLQKLDQSDSSLSLWEAVGGANPRQLRSALRPEATASSLSTRDSPSPNTPPPVGGRDKSK